MASGRLCDQCLVGDILKVHAVKYFIYTLASLHAHYSYFKQKEFMFVCLFLKLDIYFSLPSVAEH